MSKKLKNRSRKTKPILMSYPPQPEGLVNPDDPPEWSRPMLIRKMHKIKSR